MRHTAYVLAAAAVVAAGMIATTPSAFADHPNVVLEPLPGSATAGCEQTDEGCYNMPILTVAPGTTITFSNTDNAAHTLTAGSPADGPSGAFDSGLVMVGATYEFTLEEEGTYDHYCLVHPWRTGQIIVEATHGDDDAMMGDTAPADGILVYANGTHVTIDWQDAEHATRYLVQIYTGTLLADSLFVTDSILANKELRPGVLYTITATPYVDSRAGVERELAKVRVNDITDPPVPPTVRVNDITDPPVPPTPPPPFNGTISIGSETSAIEAMKLKIAELEAAIAALEGTIVEMLERMGNPNPPDITASERPPLQLPESVPGQYYIRIVNGSANATYTIGDRIHFETKLPACPPALYERLDGSISDAGGYSSIEMLGVEYASDWRSECNRQHYYVQSDGRIYTDNMVLTDPSDHSAINGSISVGGTRLAGEYYLTASVGRGYSGGDDYMYENYYSDKFTLVPPPPPIEYSDADREQVHIRLINSTGLSYGVGDLLHYEGTILQCQRNPYSGNSGHILIEVVYSDGDEDGVAWGECYSDRAEWHPEDNGYAITGNQTHFSGYVAIDELDEDYNTRQPMYLKLYVEMYPVGQVQSEYLVRNSTTFTLE